MKVISKFPMTLFCVILIWYLCLFTPPKTKLDEVNNIDKVFHVLMYLGTMGIFWCEYWHGRRHRNLWKGWRLLTLAVAAPVLMSGIIELVQAYCTNGRRSGDWLDFLANSMGVFMAYILGNTVIKRVFR